MPYRTQKIHKKIMKLKSLINISPEKEEVYKRQQNITCCEENTFYEYSENSCSEREESNNEDSCSEKNYYYHHIINKQIKLYSIEKEYSTNKKFDLENLNIDTLLHIFKYLNITSLYKLWSCHNNYINNIIENYHKFIVNFKSTDNSENYTSFEYNDNFHNFLKKCNHISGIDITRYYNKFCNSPPKNLIMNYINFNNLVYIYNFPIFSEKIYYYYYNHQYYWNYQLT